MKASARRFIPLGTVVDRLRPSMARGPVLSFIPAKDD